MPDSARASRRATPLELPHRSTRALLADHQHGRVRPRTNPFALPAGATSWCPLSRARLRRVPDPACQSTTRNDLDASRNLLQQPLHQRRPCTRDPALETLHQKHCSTSDCTSPAAEATRDLRPQPRDADLLQPRALWPVDRRRAAIRFAAAWRPSSSAGLPRVGESAR